MSMNYQDRIPNNVDLGSNRTLQRALEHWQPEFLNWWQELGPERLSGRRRLSAHGDVGRRQGVGDVRLRPHAGISLGHLPCRPQS